MKLIVEYVAALLRSAEFLPRNAVAQLHSIMMLCLLGSSSFALLPETQRNFDADDLIRKRETMQRQDKDAQEKYARSLEARNAALLEEMSKPPVHFAHYADPPIRQITRNASAPASVTGLEPVFSGKTMMLLALTSFLTALWAMRFADRSKKRS